MERNFKGIRIPKEIRLSEELTLQEKVFLVEIESLDNKQWCYANNAYFAKFFWISKTRVSIVINSLVKKWYLESSLDSDGGNKRTLKRSQTKVKDPLKEKLKTSQTKVKDPLKQKLTHNNTINNTFNNTENNTKSINNVGEAFLSTADEAIESIGSVACQPTVVSHAVEVFLKTQSERLATVRYRIESDPLYLEKNQNEYEKVSRAMKKAGYDANLLPKILDRVLQDEFRHQQIQSIAKLNKKNRQWDKYRLYLFQRMYSEKSTTYKTPSF